VRFIRHNAAQYGVKPDCLGITGGSAGGHLSLTMGTQGTKGDASAKDPIDRESSEIQCVACFFPPTDFLNYGKPMRMRRGWNAQAVQTSIWTARGDSRRAAKAGARNFADLFLFTRTSRQF